MKKILTSLIFVMCCLASFCFGCSNDSDSNIEQYYTTVYKSKELIDVVADDYYSYWYDAIYNDKYSGNINIALAYANIDNEDNIKKIKENDRTISDLYKKVKDTSLSDLIREVMTTYSDYYEFVIEISGSFNSYSSGKETKKKALASALRNLSYEIDFTESDNS